MVDPIAEPVADSVAAIEVPPSAGKPAAFAAFQRARAELLRGHIPALDELVAWRIMTCVRLGIGQESDPSLQAFTAATACVAMEIKRLELSAQVFERLAEAGPAVVDEGGS